MPAKTRIRLLELAVARLGRVSAAARLGVPLAVLDDSQSGLAPIPENKLASLLDLLDETAD